MTQHVLNQQN